MDKGCQSGFGAYNPDSFIFFANLASWREISGGRVCWAKKMSQVMSGFSHPCPLGSDTTPKRCAASERPIPPLPQMTPEYPKKTLEPFKEVSNRLESRCGKPQLTPSSPQGFMPEPPHVLKSRRSDFLSARGNRRHLAASRRKLSDTVPSHEFRQSSEPNRRPSRPG